MDFSTYLISMLAIVIAGLLLFRGLKIYKIFQMVLCGIIGGYIGLMIVQRIGNPNFLFIALIMTILGGYLGYKYYNAAFYVVAAFSTFAVVFSYYWKQAVSVCMTGVENFALTKDVALTSFKNMENIGEIGTVVQSLTNLATANVSTIINEASHILQRGVFIALIAALVMGVLAIWISDYVIIIVTSGMGALMLVNVIEDYVVLADVVHLIVLASIAVAGIAVQWRVKRR